MRHVGVAGEAAFFLLLGVDVMANLALQALGVMDAGLVPLGRPFVTVGARRAGELVIVRDGFDIIVAACARGEVAVDGLFLKSLVTVVTIFGIDGSLNMKRRNKKKEDKQRDHHT
jgi:hypothetical protein